MDYVAEVFGLEVFKVVSKIGGTESSFWWVDLVIGIFGCRSSSSIFDIFISTLYGLCGCNLWAASFQSCLENWRH